MNTILLILEGTNMKRKLLTIMLAAVLALQLASCGKNNNDEDTVSLPTETADTIETTETTDTPDSVSSILLLTDVELTSDSQSGTVSDTDTTSTPVVSKSTDTDSDTSSVASKNTSSKTSGNSSSSSSKASSSKTSSTASVDANPTTTVTVTTNGGNNNTGTNSQNTTTSAVNSSQSNTQQTTSVASYYEIVSEDESETESAAEETSEAETEVTKSAYARPYDIETIRNDMIAYGLECGLILDESLTIETGGWSSPLNTRWYEDYDSDLLAEQCSGEIDSLISFFTYHDGDCDGLRFNVQIIEIDEYPGEYRIYVVYG